MEMRNFISVSDFAKTLATLRDLPFCDLGMVADLLMIEFGERREITTLRGEWIHACEFALHAQCGWRLSQNDCILFGSEDSFQPARLEPNYVEAEGVISLLDWRINAFRNATHGQLSIESIKIGRCLSLEIQITNQYLLELLPLSSSKSDDTEWWRFFRRGDDQHVVASCQGLFTNVPSDE